MCSVMALPFWYALACGGVRIVPKPFYLTAINAFCVIYTKVSSKNRLTKYISYTSYFTSTSPMLEQ